MSNGRVSPEVADGTTVGRFEGLVRALTDVRDAEEMASFLRDLCTLAELDAMGQRLQVAVLVDEGVSYQEISKRTGASTATVTRVARWLRHGEGGYRAVLARMGK